MANRYDVEIETAIRKRGAAQDAIIKEAAKGVSMILMGVSPRSGDELFFGATTATVLDKAAGPIILVADVRTKLEQPEED